MVDKGVCDKGIILNPSNCECKCDKGCDVGEYIDCENCKYRKKLVDKLVEECAENIEETKLVKKTLDKNETKQVKKTLDENKNRVVFSISFILFIISIGIGIYFAYCKYVNRNKWFNLLNNHINGRSQRTYH